MTTTQTELIAPEQAIAYLQYNRANRPLQSSWVARLAAAMRRGEWRLNGESIKFADDGALLDGQHRLHAIIRAEKPQPMMVTRGLSGDVFNTLDQGKKRSVADILSLRGEKNAASLGATGRYVIAIERGGDFGTHYTATQIHDAIQRHPHTRMWVDKFSASKAKGFVSTTAVAVTILGDEKHGRFIADRFMDGLISGVGLAANSPVFMLRERFIDRRTSGATAERPVASAAVSIKAWNAYITGKSLKLLRFNSDEQFPSIV